MRDECDAEEAPRHDRIEQPSTSADARIPCRGEPRAMRQPDADKAGDTEDRDGCW